jgi:hypothetical protein
MEFLWAHLDLHTHTPQRHSPAWSLSASTALMLAVTTKPSCSSLLHLATFLTRRAWLPAMYGLDGVAWLCWLLVICSAVDALHCGDDGEKPWR